MSHGTIIEQGNHDELYNNDGMYRGLVDAQRISAETTGDGEETPEEVIEMEEQFRRTRSGSLGEHLMRMTTQRSEVAVEMGNVENGVVQKRKYSLWYLLKKALLSSLRNADARHCSLIRRNMGCCLWDG